MNPGKMGAASLFVVFFASSALAEPETGSRIDRAPKAVTAADMEKEKANIRVMNKFARCVADRNRSRAAAALALPYLGAEQSNAVRALVQGEEVCLGLSGGELRFQPPAMIGGLAEELILTEYRQANLASFAGMTDEALTAAGRAPRNTAEDFAQCVVRRDPATVLELIRSQPGTEVEATRAKSLAPHLGPCLIQGQSLSLTPNSIRSFVAVGLYRMLAPPATAGGS